MQGDLVASKPPVSASRLFSFDLLPSIPLRISAVRCLLVTALLILGFFTGPLYCAEGQQVEFQHLFHLVGLPGLGHDERVNLTSNAEGLLFHTKKVQYQVAYGRIHQVVLFPADRRYEGRTYAAAVATYGLGSLLILKKHHVDTVVVDYVNERGGKMGIVLQMETTQEAPLKELLRSRGVSIIEPEGVPEPLPKEETGSNSTDRSKQ
jgi:hypothetical protein